MANHQYSLTESVPLATLLTYLTGYGITIVPGSGSRIGSALAFGTLTTPYPGFGSRFDLPEGVLGDSCVILSTGLVSALRGPNNAQAMNSGSLAQPGDASLAALIGTVVGNTFDAAILTFQFIPLGTTLRIPFLFTSEEYINFVYSTFEDTMAIWLQAPGQAFPGTNIAVVPGTSTPISINTVHNGKPYGTPPVKNAQYYFNNPVISAGALSPFWMQPNGIVGLNGAGTVPMIASATVIPGQTYTLRLGICDVSDHILDSAMYLGAITTTGITGVGFPTDLPLPPGTDLPPGPGAGCAGTLPPATGNLGGAGCTAMLPTTAISYDTP